MTFYFIWMASYLKKTDLHIKCLHPYPIALRLREFIYHTNYILCICDSINLMVVMFPLICWLFWNLRIWFFKILFSSRTANLKIIFFFSLTGTVLAFKGFPTTFSGCQNMPEVRFYLTHFFQYKTYQEFLKLSSPSNGLQPYTLFFQFNFLYFK